MKRNTLVLLIAIAMISCTSSGKLTDAKFPFALYFQGYVPNKYPLPIDPNTGASIMGTYYLKADFTPTIPTNAGSYVVTTSPYTESTDLIVAKAHLKVAIIFSILIAILYIIAFISDKIKTTKPQNHK